MSSIFDSMIPSRRREQKRLREEESRLREQLADIRISAPNHDHGLWSDHERTPELSWSSPSTQGCISPSASSTLAQCSPGLGLFDEQVIIFDSEKEPAAQTYHEELGKNAITFTIPLPWPARKGHSRSPSASQIKTSGSDTARQSPALPSSQSPVVYRSTSDEYMKELDTWSRGNSPVPSPPPSSVSRASPQPARELPFRQISPVSSMGMSFARRSPSPPVDQEDGQKISAIMLLSPVVEDFPSRPTPPSTFSRASSQRHIAHFTRQVPSPPPERPSTAMSSHSTFARSDSGTAVSRATAVTDASYHTAFTHHPVRSSSRGPGLERTGMMRSASREPTLRRAMSREPSERRAISREPADRRAMSREPNDRRALSREPTSRRAMSPAPSDHRSTSRDPTSRRAMSREPSRRRAMTDDSAIYRGQSPENLPYGAFSQNGRTSLETESSDESEVGRKASNSSTTGGSYFNSLANEYRNIAWQASQTPSTDNDSMVGRVGKPSREKPRSREQYVPVDPSKELVPGGEDLYS